MVIENYLKMNNNSNEFYISELIYKSLSEKLEAKEKQDFENWLGKKENQAFYDSILNSKSINNKFDVYNSFNSDKAFSRVNERIGDQSQVTNKQIYWTYIKYAAIFIMALGLGWTVYQVNNQPAEELIQLATVEKSNLKGRKTTFRLPDGTIVNLNSDSKFEYIDDIENHRRILKLEGEAFFEVAEDKDKPFTVISGNISTTALGTSFNVKAYPAENEFKVVLITGKVAITTNGSSNDEKIYLAPGFGVTYSNKTNDLIKYNFDEEFELGWKNSTLYFDESDIDEVIMELERWYGLTIRVKNKNKVKRWKYSSKFSNESLENVLKGISYIQEFEYIIEEKEVTLIF